MTEATKKEMPTGQQDELLSDDELQGVAGGVNLDELRRENLDKDASQVDDIRRENLDKD